MPMRRAKSPSLVFLLIPLGMFGGALLSLLLGYVLSIGRPQAASRTPGDPNDGPAMLGAFLMFAGAAVGTIVGLFAALLLYLKQQQPKQNSWLRQGRT